jgi:WD40 repeat protein
MWQQEKVSLVQLRGIQTGSAQCCLCLTVSTLSLDLMIIQSESGMSNKAIQLGSHILDIMVGLPVLLYLDGEYILSGSADKTVKIWKKKTGHGDQFFFTNTHLDASQSVASSSSGTYIVSSSADKTIMMLNAKSGDFVGSPFDGHTDIVQSVTFSPDDIQLVSGSNDCTVRVWDGERNKNTTGLLLNHEVNNNTQKKHSATTYITPQGHTDYVNSVAFSPGGRYIFSGSGNKTVAVWNVETGKSAFGPLKEHADYVSSVILSPDGKNIFSGSVDRTIKS